jgi:tetratricopeptide (TPR) repeat protein
MRMRAYLIDVLDRPDEAVALYDEAAAAFSNADEPELRLNAVEALSFEARVLRRLGRPDEALTVVDRALALAADIDTVGGRRELTGTLLWKGDTLRRTDRYDEAIVVFDSTVAAYERLTNEDRDEGSLANATCAIAYAASVYGHTGSTALIETPAKLAAILGDVEGETLPPSTLERAPEWEDELAADLALTLGGDCWLTFAEWRGDEDALAALAQTAVRIYRRTEGVVPRDVEEWDSPAIAAAILLRNIADGYAMLSVPYDDQGRSRLPLPNRPAAEWGARTLGVDTWAEEHGHPLPLQEDADGMERLLEEQRSRVLDIPDDEAESRASSLATAFATLAAYYDMFEVLCRSPRGRTVRRDRRLASLTVWNVSVALQWIVWAREQTDEAQGAAAAMSLMAQAAFIATHANDVDGSELFPGRPTIRAIVHAQETYGWLVAQGAPLPAWLLPEDEEAG